MATTGACQQAVKVTVCVRLKQYDVLVFVTKVTAESCVPQSR